MMQVASNDTASRIFASWNQMGRWLRQVDGLSGSDRMLPCGQGDTMSGMTPHGMDC